MANIGGQVIKNAALNMFSRNSHLILRRFRFNTVKHCKYSTTQLESETERDPAPLFFNDDVQHLLKILTRPDPNVVFKVKKDGKPIQDPVYKFMTDEELEAERKKAYKLMEENLQMPPIVKKRDSIHEIISKNPELQGHDTAKYVFTDITYGISNNNRLIAVREPNGILRQANWEERFRMNQIYFPIDGRELCLPKMFQDEYLQDLLKRKEYEYILDKACVQYDPDDPEFHRVTALVYDRVNDASDFSKLRSTRHYGPLVFYLVWNQNINNLLLENIKKELIEDAALLIKLNIKINPTSELSGTKHDGDHVNFIEQYINASANKGKLFSAMSAYKELIATRKKVNKGVQDAHGWE